MMFEQKRETTENCAALFLMGCCICNSCRNSCAIGNEVSVISVNDDHKSPENHTSTNKRANKRTNEQANTEEQRYVILATRALTMKNSLRLIAWIRLMNNN